MDETLLSKFIFLIKLGAFSERMGNGEGVVSLLILIFEFSYLTVYGAPLPPTKREHAPRIPLKKPPPLFFLRATLFLKDRTGLY